MCKEGIGVLVILVDWIRKIFADIIVYIFIEGITVDTN